MQKTEKKHWENGHQIRGGWFNTLNLSLFNIGLMIAWPSLENGHGINLNFYKLIK